MAQGEDLFSFYQKSNHLYIDTCASAIFRFHKKNDPLNHPMRKMTYFAYDIFCIAMRPVGAIATDQIKEIFK